MQAYFGILMMNFSTTRLTDSFGRSDRDPSNCTLTLAALCLAMGYRHSHHQGRPISSPLPTPTVARGLLTRRLRGCGQPVGLLGDG